MDAKKRIFSGIQPSGDLTLGSYMGAIKNWVALQDEYDCLYCIVDMHAITVRQVPADLRRRTPGAAGAVYRLRPRSARRTSCSSRAMCPQHAELCWVLGCYTQFGELSRMTQFKDEIAAARRQHHRRPLHLSGADGGGHSAVSGRPCPGRRGSEAACRALPRHRARASTTSFPDTFTLPEPFIPQDGRTHHEPRHTGEQNVQVRSGRLRIPDGSVRRISCASSSAP